ncbi:MAG: ATP synthase F1 subunit delta [Oscillospiraceae bacterium]|nr:ATP synthase F1 subunit delta [Oscillospiraceae bacterium]MBQ6851351.1 ATP synthase F1 subunit delta [Oscillospiraceae bacterium]MBR6609902.1 ATP synthase F1 subunit delta [Oscillospiraceae bacterium]
MSNISRAYADALYEICIEENSLEEIMQQSAQLAEIMAANPEFVKLLNAPTVTKEEKTDLVDKVFSGKINKSLLNFIKVMVERKDTQEINASFADFEKLYNKHNNIEKATATTAVPMSDEQKAKLVAKLNALTGKNVVLTNIVDPACIGGVILQFADVQYNDSVAGKLEILRNQLKAN